MNICDNSVTIPEDKNRKRKTLEELTIRDDFMFSKVFSKSIERAKYFIELTLGREVAEIRFHKDQYSINDFYNSKGIRLDVLLVGATEWIDVEMQNQGGSDLVQRNQYYTSLMTVDSLETGLDYDKSPRIITIFITGFDPFGLGYEKYICLENLYGELPSGIKNDVTQEANYDGRCVKIYLNVSNILPTYRTSSEELRNVLDYFRTSNPTSKFALELSEEVASAKKDANVRREFMVFEELVKNERNEAKEEGIAEGEQNKAIEVAKNLLQMGGYLIYRKYF